ncbi:MAG TPA: DNA-3-methyladenine glycosylase [Solirubrobacteraceae bacterium]|nr:DNA-3-methyladenine glycosylase [Solirubrobacteraceae bacterium]
MNRDFYDRPVLDVARDLVGCTLIHGDCAGIVVETEAYHFSEPACHAYVGVTARTEVLWGPPGIAYVYRSYGIHALLNAVTEPEGVGSAVLIRAMEPTDGIELMRARRGPVPDRELSNGPGKLTQALGIGLELNGTSLLGEGPIEFGPRPRPVDVVRSAPRIGISRAVDLDWRFTAVGSPHVSRPFPKVASPAA